MEDINIELLENKSLQYQIHQLKEQFISLYANIANQIPDSDLLLLDPNHKGKKISKGNELQHCPYQVLDIVRNFDKKFGFNIRILNWWGHGLFILVFNGAENIPSHDEYQAYLSNGFSLSLCGSPWDYQGMIVQNMQSNEIHYDGIPAHLKKFRHLQLIKKIPYRRSAEDLEKNLMEEWATLKKFRSSE